MKPNFECKRCGLLQSTVLETGAECIPDNRMGTTLKGLHYFFCSECKKPYCKHWESDFDRFIINNKKMQTIDDLKKDMEEISGEWDGDNPGLKEDRAHIASEVLEKIKEIEELLKELSSL